MDCFNQRDAFFIEIVGERARRGFGSTCRLGPVPGAVDNE